MQGAGGSGLKFTSFRAFMAVSTLSEMCVKIMILDCVHMLPAHFASGKRYDGSKISASIYIIPAQLENNRKFGCKKPVTVIPII